MKTLAFIDSGIGGLPYLSHTRSLIPDNRYIYCADTIGFPYGTKSEEQIRQSFGSMVERIERNLCPDVYVVACNTASVVALSWLRERFTKPFVGVVPAVKPAAQFSKRGVLGILATERTVRGKYLEDLVQTHAPHCRVIRRAASELISRIESDPFLSDKNGMTALLQEIKDDFIHHGADSIVLGCTHFLLCEDLFRETMGENLHILDSREGVSRQTIKVLHQTILKNTAPDKAQAIEGFYLSGTVSNMERYEKVARAWSLEFRGELGE
jgi:glutamate racemase